MQGFHIRNRHLWFVSIPYSWVLGHIGLGSSEIKPRIFCLILSTLAASNIREGGSYPSTIQNMGPWFGSRIWTPVHTSYLELQKAQNKGPISKIKKDRQYRVHSSGLFGGPGIY